MLFLCSSKAALLKLPNTMHCSSMLVSPVAASRPERQLGRAERLGSLSAVGQLTFFFDLARMHHLVRSATSLGLRAPVRAYAHATGKDISV